MAVLRGFFKFDFELTAQGQVPQSKNVAREADYDNMYEALRRIFDQLSEKMEFSTAEGKKFKVNFTLYKKDSGLIQSSGDIINVTR